MSDQRVYNFSAGPSMLPLSALERAGSEITNYRGSGMSVMEMSHRSKAVSYTHLDVYKRQVLNIALDPVFIFWLNMGVRGAAIATVISQLGSCLFVLHFLFGPVPQVRITFGGYSRKIISRVLLTGLAPFLIIALDLSLIHI